MCSRLSYEGKLVYLGLGNGKILSYDPVSKQVTQVAKCTLSSIGTLGIQDLVLCSEKKLAVVDTNSTIRFFVKEKLVHTMAAKCQFISKPRLLAHSNQIGKLLHLDGPYLYYVSPTHSCFFKVNIKNYETQEVPLTGYKVFQISVALGRVYAIGEDGTIEVAFPKGDTLGQNVKPVMKAKDESDDEDDAVMKNKEYDRKSVKIEDIPETVVDHPDAHNASILAGSEAEDDEEEEHHHHQESSIKEKSYLSEILSDKNRNGRAV